MKKRNMNKLWASVLVITLTLAALVTVKAQIISIQEAEESEDFDILATYDYEILWDVEYRKGIESFEVATDYNDDVIVVGFDGVNGVIVKYDRDDGSLLWDKIITESFNEALDSDMDTMPDYWEYEYSLDSSNPADANLDADSDLLTNAEEYHLNTNPCTCDSDEDGLNDYEEVTIGADGYITDPNDADSDNDEINDGMEYINGTNPNDPYESPFPMNVLEQLYDMIGLTLHKNIALIFFDVAVDQQNNVIAIGVALNLSSEDGESDVYVVKYDSDGNEIWERLLDIGLVDGPMVGVTTDSDDNIFITGFSFSKKPIKGAMGWVYKLGKYLGCTHWRRLKDITAIPQPVYWDVDVDSSDNVYTAGNYLDVDWDQELIIGSDMIITKRCGLTGIQLAETVIEHPEGNSLCLGLEIDDNDDDVFLAGEVEIGTKAYQELVKMDLGLTNYIWKLTNNNMIEGDLFDVDVMSNGDPVVTGSKPSLKDDFYTAIWDEDTGSALLLEIIEGSGVDEQGNPIQAQTNDESGIAVDSNGNIITTGYRKYNTPPNPWYFYTMKYGITTGESWYCFSESQYYTEVSPGYLGPATGE